MLAKVAGGLRVTCVKVTSDHTAISFPLAVLSIALEDMNTALIDIFDQRGGPEEDVDR
jgi:hypothetical protein